MCSIIKKYIIANYFSRVTCLAYQLLHYMHRLCHIQPNNMTAYIPMENLPNVEYNIISVIIVQDAHLFGNSYIYLAIFAKCLLWNYAWI